MRVGLWSVGDDGTPRRLEQRRDFLEVDLEGWIEAHPELVAEGLTWVGRQVILPGRPRIDLVGVTREGQLVVAELKRGAIDVATLTQALFYALAIAAMDPEGFLGRLRLDEEMRELLLSGVQSDGHLDLALLLVGTARAPEIDRASDYLSSRGLDLELRVVTFVPFVDDRGHVLLAREIAEQEQAEDEITPRRRTARGARVEWVQQRARELDVGPVIEEAITIAGELGLKVRPWPKSITVVPATGMMKTLIYLGVKQRGYVGFGYSSENIAALYGVNEQHVVDTLGSNWEDLPPGEVGLRLASFAALMSALLTPEEETVVGGAG
jgi:hypothetical protein